MEGQIGRFLRDLFYYLKFLTNDPIIFYGPMRQKGEKVIVLNPPNKTQSYPRNLLLFLQKALVCQISNVIFDLRHQYGICEAKTVAEIAVRAIDISVRRSARLLI